jgi:hypothetical protein
MDEKNKENLRIGKIHFHIIWSYFGFCQLVNNKTKLSPSQQIIIALGGPCISLLIAISFFILHNTVGFSNQINSFIFWIGIYNLFNFLVTIIPIKYPTWWKPYGNMPSDGYRVLRALKR